MMMKNNKKFILIFKYNKCFLCLYDFKVFLYKYKLICYYKYYYYYNLKYLFYISHYYYYIN